MKNPDVLKNWSILVQISISIDQINYESKNLIQIESNSNIKFHIDLIA